MRQVGGTLPVFYHGLVEDRNDPLKLGRVRVRVLGVHSDNVLDVPTEDLPWAPVAISPTNAGTSGLGWSPTGLVPGSWVIVYFSDGQSLQQPVVMGTTIGINPQTKQTQQSGSTTKTVVKKTTKITKPTAKSIAEAAAKDQEEWVPGYITKRREAGLAGGAWTIAKDANGYSYGSIQVNQAQMGSYLAQSKFKDEFTGMTPGTAEFNAKWDKLGKAHPEEFAAEQEEYSKSKNYNPMMSKMKSYGLENRSPAVQEALYSTANQYGPSKGATLCKTAFNGKDVASMSDADVIKCIYDQKRNTVDSSFKGALAKGTASRKGLINGWNSEEEALLADAPDSVTDLSSGTTLPDKNAYGEPIIEEYVTTETVSVPLKIGFVDPSGKYPTTGYLGDPDTNRLARNAKTQKTIVATKKTQRLVSKQYSEPETKYNSKYPYNKVFQSEAGHIIEIDDTPGSERLHIYHKSGTFVEFHPNGTVVKKVFGQDHEIVLGDKEVYVTGTVTINVEGNANINSQGNISLKAEQNLELMAGNNITIAAGNEVDLNASKIFRYAAGNRVEKIRPRVWSTPATGKTINAEADEISVEVGNKVSIMTAPPILETITDDDTFDPAQTLFSTKKELDSAAGYNVAPEGSATKPKELTVPKQSPGTAVPLPSTYSASTRLSEHFTIGDLTTGCVVSKYALREQAGLSEEEIARNLQNLAINVLEPLVAHFGRNKFIITNCFRHTKSTDSKTSQHCLGQAVDIQFPAFMGNDHVHKIEEIRRLLPAYDQLILEWHSPNGVIHISYNSERLRKVAFTTYTTNFHGLKGGAFFDRSQTLIYA